MGLCGDDGEGGSGGGNKPKPKSCGEQLKSDRSKCKPGTMTAWKCYELASTRYEECILGM